MAARHAVRGARHQPESNTNRLESWNLDEESEILKIY